MNYNYQEVANRVIPSVVVIEAYNKEETTTIDLKYKNLEFNKELRFPYKVPKGFKRMML